MTIMCKASFCVYFDHRYLPQGLTLYRSLKAWCPEAHLYVLALSESCKIFLENLGWSDLHVISLPELESYDRELCNIKATRTGAEYIFTLTPSWIRYLLRSDSDMKMLTYIDADTAFFSSPSPALSSLRTSVGVVGHRFPPRLNHLLCYGRFNVGWNTFCNDETAHACLDFWRDRCLDWCRDICDAGRFADQGYLDEWPELFGVQEIPHKGINVAPWNVDTFKFSSKNGAVWVDEYPLVFFHFQGMRRLWNCICESGLVRYKSTMTPLLRELVFTPYLQALLKTAEEFQLELWESLSRGQICSWGVLYLYAYCFAKGGGMKNFWKIPKIGRHYGEKR